MGKYIHICKQCGKEFSNYTQSSMFCGKECYNLHRKQQSKMKQLICPICKNQFVQKRSNQVFCSVECRVKSTENKIECICEYCGKVFCRIKSEVDKNDHHYCSVECRMNKMGWTDEDTEILRENFSKFSYKEMVNFFSTPKTPESIKRRANYIGLTSTRAWSDEEIEILVKNYSTKTMQEMMILLPKRSKFSILGQAKTKQLKSLFYISHMYSEEENNYLLNNYLNKSNEELGQVLNRTANGISQHLWTLGVSRPTDINNYETLYNYVRKRIYPWRNRIIKNSGVCALTGSNTDIVVHHIRGFNLLFKETIEILDFPIYDDLSKYTREQLDELVQMFFTIQNYYNSYVCIHKDVHKLFHHIYGYGNNSEEQWIEFVNKYYK